MDKNDIVTLNGLIQNPKKDYTYKFGKILFEYGLQKGDEVQLFVNGIRKKLAFIEQDCKGIDIRYHKIYYILEDNSYECRN